MSISKHIENTEENPEKGMFYAWQFTGQGKEYFSILVVNVLFSIVTLGVYAAWAKVRRNRYLYGHTRIAGEAMQYHATGVMIFKGRLMAVAVILAFSIAQLSFSGVGSVSYLVYLPLLLLFPWILNQSLSFRARMLSWRNVRFRWTGTVSGTARALWPYILLAFLYLCFLIRSADIGRERLADAGIQINLTGIEFFVFSVVFFALIIVGGYIWARYVSQNMAWGNVHLRSHFSVGQYFTIIARAGLMIVVSVLLVFGLSFVLFDEHTLPVLLIVGIAIFYAMIIVLILTSRFMVRNLIVSQAEAKNSQAAQVAYFYSNIAWKRTLLFHVQNTLLFLCSLSFAYAWIVVRTQKYLTERTGIIFVSDMNNVIDDAQRAVSSAASEYADLDGIDISPW